MKYYFRGVVVFDYDPKTKQTKVPNDETTNGNFNFCRFIPEDYKLMEQFFNTAYRHAIGEITDDELTDIEVN